MEVETKEVIQWGVAGVVGIVTLFVKSLHKKIEGSASKEELVKLEKDLKESLDEIKEAHTSERRELRDNQIKLFEKLELQSQLLTQVATEVKILVSQHGKRQ